ncbi:organic radical activating enzyme [Candidatus Kinetoplastibacterium desouzaii TCC079E]|uniref:7-carboxy-7-deazaguanine synthase n=1 Tax=Candidatus Kinetoplastidibacterium desouzai TCC079E TaxID=1208919 RepID=M1LU49_9PROT|nr:7-carboxy-7-deazaguanine synthase [Candidatus Kinetoplastibacterium desouzaii]AGF46814.1 organic radical activating enzyme [Candidatus Kinetoplastibacterium desouzaii TCC079E]
MSYSVKEIFKSLQGEGFHTGRVAIFCRFSGCNLWNGKEYSKSSALCKFCDTDFVGTDGINGGKFKSADSLAQKILEEWGDGRDNRYVILTGGEPLLQVDIFLIEALHKINFTVAIETNGTIVPPNGIDWVCVSPKGSSNIILKEGNELKLVYPQLEIDPSIFLRWNFQYFFLQPLDDYNVKFNTKLTVDYCINNPKWRLSLQTHKYIGIP